MTPTEFIEDLDCRGYLLACETDIRKGPRMSHYADLLAMFAHAGRLVEFGPGSYHKFMAEARNQDFRDSQLIQALDGILETLSDEEAWPQVAERFEFAAFVGHFLLSYAESNAVSPLLVEKSQRYGLSPWPILCSP